MECFVIFVMAWCWFNATESKPQNVSRDFMKNLKGTMNKYDFFYKKYSEIEKSELIKIEELILKGGEVNPNTLSERLSEADLISFAKLDKNIVATASIKKPLKNYKLKVFTKSNSKLSPEKYNFELGYIMVEKEYRQDKLASTLCKKLCEIYSLENIFATTRVENIGMKIILEKNSFIETGENYLSDNEKTNLNLYIK